MSSPSQLLDVTANNCLLRRREGISSKLNASSSMPIIPDLPTTGLFGLTYGQASAGNGFRNVPVIDSDNDKNLDIVKSHLGKTVDDEEVSTGFLDCSGRVDSSEEV